MLTFTSINSYLFNSFYYLKSSCLRSKNIQVLAPLVGLFFAHTLWAQSSPVPMLEQTTNQIITTLQKNQSSLKTNHRIIYGAIEQHLLPHVDLTGMARSVLGRQAWMKATVAERQAFTKEFTALVIRTYANPLAEYAGETVQFSSLRNPPHDRFVRVNSVIIRKNGQRIPLSYSLVLKNGEWKIYDFNVEGISLLQSFRTQFAQVLQGSDMNTLLAQMRERKSAA